MGTERKVADIHCEKTGPNIPHLHFVSSSRVGTQWLVWAQVTAITQEHFKFSLYIRCASIVSLFLYGRCGGLCLLRRECASFSQR